MTEEQEQIPGTEYTEVSMTPLFAFISGIVITIALFLIIGGISLYYINQSYENEKIAKQADLFQRTEIAASYLNSVPGCYSTMNKGYGEPDGEITVYMRPEVNQKDVEILFNNFASTLWTNTCDYWGRTYCIGVHYGTKGINLGHRSGISITYIKNESKK